MENTGKVLFGGESQPQWLIALGNQSIGPMTASEVYERVSKGEITWAHFVWKEGQPDWKRICDVPTFQAAVPAPPSVKPATPPTPPGKVKPEVKEWFLYFDETQTGPFSEGEIKGMLASGKVTTEAHTWKDGMSDWQTLSSLSQWSQQAPSPVTIQKPNGNKRQHERKPLIAKVMIAEDTQFYVGICRDISIGGMQVLCEYVPSQVGAKLKLNVSPHDVTNPSFQPFVAEGVVVRILDDRRGFSFRFDERMSGHKAVIERIIAAS